MRHHHLVCVCAGVGSEGRWSSAVCGSRGQPDKGISESLITDCVAVTTFMCLLTALTRHHDRPHHDHAEYYCQEIPPESLLRDRHGPVRVRLLHLRLRRTYRVRHLALLCQQQKAECQKGQEEEKPGEHLSKMRAQNCFD